MFSNTLQSLILFNIYALALLSFIIIGGIYFVILRDTYRKKRYKAIETQVAPLVEDCLLGSCQILPFVKSDYSKMVVIDLLTASVKKNNSDEHEKFQHLGLDVFLMKKIKKDLSLDYLRKLIYMKTETAYDLFIKLSVTKNIEVVYTSLLGLIMMALSKEKKINVLKLVLDSEIPKERKIELARNFDFDFDKFIQLIEEENSEESKSILLKTLGRHKDLEENKKALLPYLNESKELRIATIQSLSRIQSSDQMEFIYSLYEKEEDWEVRVNIVKSLSYYQEDTLLKKLEVMARDDQWWVRYNAAKSMLALGEKGVAELKILSLNKEAIETSKMATYFLALSTEEQESEEEHGNFYSDH